MASISERTRAGGRKVFVVQIIRRNFGNYRDSQTFSNRRDAEAWAKKREAEIELSIAEGRDLRGPQPGKETLGDAIDAYLKDQASIGRTKAQCLRTIRNEYAICDKPCDVIRSATIVDFARQIANRPDVTSRSTVGNYLSHLAAVFKYAPALSGFLLDKAEMDKALAACQHSGLIGRAAKRERRPTLEELDTLLDHFVRSSQRDARIIPMHLITIFAIFSTRRQDEITRILWEDYDEEEKQVLVRKMKHPGMRGGVDTVCELPDPCTEILRQMPKISDRIFPFNTDVVSRRFTDACKLLEIRDLRFHDLRHEGISRLAELGRTVPQLASTSGHKSWQSLERYSHVRKLGDKYQNWPWMHKLLK